MGSIQININSLPEELQQTLLALDNVSPVELVNGDGVVVSIIVKPCVVAEINRIVTVIENNGTKIDPAIFIVLLPMIEIIKSRICGGLSLDDLMNRIEQCNSSNSNSN